MTWTTATAFTQHTHSSTTYLIRESLSRRLSFITFSSLFRQFKMKWRLLKTNVWVESNLCFLPLSLASAVSVFQHSVSALRAAYEFSQNAISPHSRTLAPVLHSVDSLRMSTVWSVSVPFQHHRRQFAKPIRNQWIDCHHWNRGIGRMCCWHWQMDRVVHCNNFHSPAYVLLEWHESMRD